jgi:hypothetical protein
MKDKLNLSDLKKLTEDLEKFCEGEEFKVKFPVELKDLEQALTLLKSVRRRIKAKSKT